MGKRDSVGRHVTCRNLLHLSTHPLPALDIPSRSGKATESCQSPSEMEFNFENGPCFDTWQLGECPAELALGQGWVGGLRVNAYIDAIGPLPSRAAVQWFDGMPSGDRSYLKSIRSFHHAEYICICILRGFKLVLGIDAMENFVMNINRLAVDFTGMFGFI